MANTHNISYVGNHRSNDSNLLTETITRNITTKEISIRKIISWSGHHILWLLLLMGSIATLYHFNIIRINF